MRLRVVGCSGTVPGAASAASCYLIEADAGGRTWRLLLDLGSGALGSLQRWCDPREIDAVAISHLHPDHCADLAPLHAYLAHHPDVHSGRTSIMPVPVFGPFGTASHIEALRGKPEPSPVLNVHVWQSRTVVEVGPMRLTAIPVEHSVPAYALRVEGPGEDGGIVALTYSGDTDACEGLLHAAADTDLFLCEATFVESDGAVRGLHLTAAEAGALAQHAGASRLLLTHIPPWTDPHVSLAEARKAYDGVLDVAHPGLEVLL